MQDVSVAGFLPTYNSEKACNKMSDFNPYDQQRRRGSWLGAVVLVLAIILVSLLLKGKFHERGGPATNTDVMDILDANTPRASSAGLADAKGKPPAAEQTRFGALRELLDRGYGRPAQPLGSGPDEPIQVVINKYPPA